MRTMMNLAGVSVNEAVKMATATPAKHLGVFNKKGSISVGKDADLLLFDDDIRIKAVYLAGKEVLV